MSRICAIIGHDAENIIYEISQNLKHCISDNEYIFINKNVAIGNVYSIKEKDHISNLVLSNEKKDIFVTLDGILYNIKELLSQSDDRYAFKTQSYAELIIRMYENYGFNCVNRFGGDFAFCLWDMNKKILFSARDRLGLKPLYYYHDKDRFIISSEIKGILADSSVPKIPNNTKIYEYLLDEKSNNPGDTFFFDIKELIPGHYMILKDNNIIMNKYWELDKKLKDNKIEYANEFYDKLLNAIKIRLTNNQKIGMMCSGGLDSAIITFMLNEILECKDKYEIFSAIYNIPIKQDEKYYIDIVMKALNKNINYVYPSMETIDDVKNFIYHMEEPVDVLNYYVFWCILKILSKKVKICLSGLGCDAILGGQNEHVITYLKELWNDKKIYKLLNELLKSIDWFTPWLLYSIFFKEKNKSKIKQLINPEFIFQNNQGIRKKEKSSLQKIIYKDITEHAVEYLRVCDKASSHFSIECRHPFLDYSLVEFSYSLPNDQRIRDGWTKYILRNAVKGLIPESIRKNRKKYGTPIPQKYWFNTLRFDIKKILKSEHFMKREYFNQSIILDVFERYCDGKLNRIECEDYQVILWKILNLELWLEIYFQ